MTGFYDHHEIEPPGPGDIKDDIGDWGIDMTDPRHTKLVAQMRVLARESGIPLPPGRTFDNVADTTLRGVEQAGLLVIDPESLSGLTVLDADGVWYEVRWSSAQVDVQDGELKVFVEARIPLRSRTNDLPRRDDDPPHV